MKHDETLGQAPPQGTTDASATNRVDHGGCPSDLQPLIQRMYDEAAQCDVFGITKPAAMLREAAEALQHAANMQAMDEFAEVATAGHLSDAEHQKLPILPTDEPVAERDDDGAPSVEEARRMGEQGSAAVEGERLAFEAWMSGHCWALCATWTGKGYIGEGESVSEGRYVCRNAMATRRMWAAWRDRAALARLKTPYAAIKRLP